MEKRDSVLRGYAEARARPLPQPQEVLVAILVGLDDPPREEEEEGGQGEEEKEEEESTDLEQSPKRNWRRDP